MKRILMWLRVFLKTRSMDAGKKVSGKIWKKALKNFKNKLFPAWKRIGNMFYFWKVLKLSSSIAMKLEL